MFLAQFGNEGLIVIKSVPDPTVKLMAHSLLTFSKLFRLPAIAVMHAGHPEFRQMIFHLDKVAMGNQELRETIRNNLTFAFVVIEEFVPGFDLSEVRGDRAEFLFHPDALRSYKQRPTGSTLEGWVDELQTEIQNERANIDEQEAE